MKHSAARVALFSVAACSLAAQTPESADRADSVPTASKPVTTGQPVPAPLSENERADGYLTSLVNPFSFFASGVSAGIGQWRDRPTEWGQGAEGFGKRYRKFLRQPHRKRHAVVWRFEPAK